MNPSDYSDETGQAVRAQIAQSAKRGDAGSVDYALNRLAFWCDGASSGARRVEDIIG